MMAYRPPLAAARLQLQKTTDADPAKFRTAEQSKQPKAIYKLKVPFKGLW